MIDSTSNIRNVLHTELASANPIPKETKLQRFDSYVIPPRDLVSRKWNDRAIKWLREIEAQLDQKLPNLTLQNRWDELAYSLKAKFAPLKEFNRWLDSNGEGEWYLQLATFLAKLPVRAVRNIVRLLFNIVKGLTSAIVHPLKACTKLARLVIRFAHSLTQVETWTKMGAGLIGASLSQFLVMGNPLSIIGSLIGAHIMVGGLLIGTLKKALDTEKGEERRSAVQDYLISQGLQIPEAILTGFLMGLLLGGMQRGLHRLFAKKTPKIDPSPPDIRLAPWEAKDFANGFIKTHQLPPPQAIFVSPFSGKITILWDGGNLESIRNMMHLQPIYPSYAIGVPKSVFFELAPHYTRETGQFFEMSLYANNHFKSFDTLIYNSKVNPYLDPCPTPIHPRLHP